MNYITFSSRTFLIAIKKHRRKETIALLIILVLGSFPVKKSVAQIPNCGANVPTYNVNFVGNPSGTFTTPNTSRLGNCCGTSSPDRCIHFSFVLDTADVAVNFQISSGAIPPGALFYQIDCGPQQQVGNHICISGAGVHHLTFCKPGNNVNTYTMTAIPHPLVPAKDTVRVGCSKNINALGYTSGSITWNSIFPGTPGAYNSYLSCTSGCTNPLFTPQAASPPFIDYVVCGSPTATGCGLALTICDTVRMYVYPALTVTVSPNPASFCPSSPGVTLTASPVGGFGSYSYVWKKAGVTVGNAASYFATSAGTYTVSVIDQLTACPTITVSVPVTISNVSLTPSHTNVSCNGGSNGTATVVVSGGATPYTYVWSPNVGTTSTVTGLIAGTYNVTVSDAGTCSQNTNIVVSQPTPLVPVVTSTTNVTCHGQSTGAIDISVSGGTAPYTYHWSSGQTTQDISGVPAGNYTDTIFDALGCIATILDSITEPAAIITLPSSGSINGTDLTCYGSGDGSASVTVVGGTLPYSYLWSTGPGDTTASVTGLSAGTISVVITDANGCSANASTVINQPDSITASTFADSVYFGGYNITCHGATNGFASVHSLNGGTPPYSYLWSNNDTTPDLSNVPAGHYVVTITDAHGCILMDSVDLDEPDSLVGGVTSPFTAGGYNIACKGESSGSMDISIIGGTPPFIIAWSTGDSNTTHLTHLFAGFYSVNITDNNGCTAIDTITLTEPDTLVPLITATVVLGGSNIKCYGGTMDSATVIVTGGTPPFSFMWSPTNDSTQTIYNIYSDTITVLVHDTNGCSGSDDYFVAQPSPILSTVSSSLYNGGYNVSCFAATDGYAIAVPTGGTSPYAYVWSNTATTDSIYNLAAGNYNVTITDTNGCVKLDSVLLSEPDSLYISAVPDTYPSGDNISCHGASDGSISSLVNGGANPYSYVWSSSPADTTADVSGLTVGGYSVTVTDDNGCTARDSVTLTEPTPLVIDSLYSPVYLGGWNISCNGGDNGSIFSWASGGSPPYAYSWSNGDTTQNTLNVSVFTYIDTVIDLNGCRVIDSITLTEPQPIILIASSVAPASCFGSPTGHITVTTTGGTQPFQFSIDGINFSSSNTFSNLFAGTYIIYAADTNGCADSIMVIIAQPANALNSSISAQTNVNCFGNATGSVTVSTTGGTHPYSFSIGGPFQPDSTFSNLPSGPYVVTIRDSNNCTTTVAITITQPSATLSAFILTQTNVDCFSNATGEVTITTTGGTPPYQYSIGGGPFQQSNTFSNLPANSYTITVRDTHNCITTVPVNITQPATALSASIVLLSNVDCHGNSTGTIIVNVTGGTPNYLCSFNGGPYNSIFTFNNLPAGVDTIRIKDANECKVILDTVITEPAVSLTASVTSQVNVDCHGNNNGSLTVQGSGGTPTYQYSLDGGVTWVSSPTFNNLTGGVYVIIVRDLNACTAITSTTILQPSASLNLSVSSNIPVDCFGSATGSLTASVTGGTGPYSFSIGGAFQPDSNFTNLAAGPYTITVMDGHNCTATFNTNISQPTGPLIANAGSSISVCGTTATLSAVLNPGASGTWTNTGTGTGTFVDPHSATTNVTGLSLGNNTFQWYVSSGNCSDSALVTITQDAVILADGGGNADTCYNESTHFVLHATSPGTGNGFWTVVLPASGTIDNPGAANANFTPSTAPSVSAVIWTVINGTCTDRDTILLNYLKGGECFHDLDLPSAFSPNSDSHNDAYVIHGIERYPENKFVVFNRWGNEVYSKDNYMNHGADDADWKGQNKNDEKLPDGTYFVVLTIPKSDIVRTTYVDIRR